MLPTRQGHSAEARIVCERFVKSRVPGDVRFAGEKVRDRTATRYVVTGRARSSGEPAKSFTCLVGHAGNSWP